VTEVGERMGKALNLMIFLNTINRCMHHLQHSPSRQQNLLAFLPLLRSQREKALNFLPDSLAPRSFNRKLPCFSWKGREIGKGIQLGQAPQRVPYYWPQQDMLLRVNCSLIRGWPRKGGNQQYRAPSEQRKGQPRGEPSTPPIDNEPTQAHIHIISRGETLAGHSLVARKSYAHQALYVDFVAHVALSE